MADDVMNDNPVAEPSLETAHDPSQEASLAPETAGEASTSATGKIALKRSGIETDIVFTLHPPSTIGRFDAAYGPIDVDLGGLPEGSYISRKHAKITSENGVWTLHDLGSSNGSFVLRSDDFQREESFVLTEGVEFALGNARFVFHLEEDGAEPVAASAEPEATVAPPSLASEPVHSQ